MRTRTMPFLPPGTEPLTRIQVLLGVDADDLEVLDGHGIATHVTRRRTPLKTRDGVAH